MSAQRASGIEWSERKKLLSPQSRILSGPIDESLPGAIEMSNSSVRSLFSDYLALQVRIQLDSIQIY